MSPSAPLPPDPQEVDRLFDRALDLPPEERRPFLEAATHGNPALMREVEALLAASEVAEGALGESVGDFAGALLDDLTERLATDDGAMAPGSRVGAWEIEGELGRGGMGVVYLARRADGAFHRQVALKVVKRGMDTDEILQRFRYERRILAGLTHPNIARLLDGGATDDGRPYLVVERVEGRPIDRYAQEEGLDVEARLALFREVLAAVDHAHRSLVVHRDLKPSNILVEADGTVKLLDFGIAKVLASDGEMTAPATRTAVRMLTPEYAAPEQLRGDPITTATDVYALGLLLSRLLTGSARGDLERILLRALEEDPARRYPSAAALDEDIRRHLAHEPILARGYSAVDRAGRFLRRHRLGVAVAAAVVLLVGSYGVTLRISADRLERERALTALEARRAEGVTEFLVGLFQDPGLQGTAGDTLTARALLDRGARRIWNEDGPSLDPDTRAAALVALGRAYRGLGNSDLSIPILEEAVALRRAGGAQGGSLVEALEALAGARSEARHFTAADSLYRQVMELAGPVPDSLRLAFLMVSHAGVIRDLGRPDSTLTLTRAAVELFDRHAPDDHPGRAGFFHDLGYAQRGVGNLEEAADAYLRSLELRRAHADPDRVRIARSLNNLGVVFRELGRFHEAEATFREAWETASTELGPEHPRTTVKGMHLAQELERRGGSTEAEAILLGQVEAVRERWGAGHWSVGQGHVRLGDLLMNYRGDPRAAALHYREAARIFTIALGPDHEWTLSAQGTLARVEEEVRLAAGP
ncbi:MAG: serine/threonine protein kinase [Gemmatimonadales bacterium]|nr:MAG: serine/threonine protein kinase [Gemmatimonadales bacterium]